MNESWSRVDLESIRFDWISFEQTTLSGHKNKAGWFLCRFKTALKASLEGPDGSFRSKNGRNGTHIIYAMEISA